MLQQVEEDLGKRCLIYWSINNQLTHRYWSGLESLPGFAAPATAGAGHWRALAAAFCRRPLEIFSSRVTSRPTTKSARCAPIPSRDAGEAHSGYRASKQARELLNSGQRCGSSNRTADQTWCDVKLQQRHCGPACAVRIQLRNSGRRPWEQSSSKPSFKALIFRANTVCIQWQINTKN